MMTISAVILFHNEEENIEKCLESVSWCDEIIVIDDYSQDQTQEKIRNPKSLPAQAGEIRNKVKVYQRHLDSDFAGQRNFGLAKAIGNWILFVDADEIISKELASEIRSEIKSINNGFYIQRKDYIFGKWLKYGETGNIKFIRLARKEAGIWTGRVHEVWEVKGIAGELKNPILHYPHQTVSEFLKRINWYTDLVVQCWKGQGKVMSFWEIVFYPPGKFIQNYVSRLGFLDGTPGLILAVFMSFHSFLARSKYWLLSHDSPRSE